MVQGAYEQHAAKVNNKMKLLPEHCKGARAMLGITQTELAKDAGVAMATVHLFEKGESDPTEDTLLRLQMALESRGVEFLNSGNPGVRLRRTAD